MTKPKIERFSLFGILIMVLLSLTQFLPFLRLSGYSVIVGLAFFFISNPLAKRSDREAGLAFKTIGSDLKKPGVLLILVLPILTSILPNLIGDLALHNGFSAHVLARAGNMLSYDNIPLLVLQVIILALGEEIAWRGFFLGRLMTRFPFWVCAVSSSLLFAIGHLSSGNLPLVLFDLAFVFIDSLIFSIIFKKSGNCAVSWIAHVLGNATGIIVCLIMT